uniref:winged helix-turn-helix transcriptional regulator n=1 Tax=Herbidospora sakaeratensis TaxID=564415 RepID=UPI001FE0DE43|nr:helix-turn-helix domain-containing protein [Herbidospora sakaeratensis]
MAEPLDPDMFAGCAPVTSPVRIGDKWTAKIIRCLQDGPRRYSELKVPLTGITPKVLTESLRSMERDGLLTRTAHPGIPPKVVYELSPLGHSLVEPLDTMCAWSRANLPKVLSARDAYDVA